MFCLDKCTKEAYLCLMGLMSPRAGVRARRDQMPVINVQAYYFGVVFVQANCSCRLINFKIKMRQQCWLMGLKLNRYVEERSGRPRPEQTRGVEICCWNWARSLLTGDEVLKVKEKDEETGEEEIGRPGRLEDQDCTCTVPVCVGGCGLRRNDRAVYSITDPYRVRYL